MRGRNGAGARSPWCFFRRDPTCDNGLRRQCNNRHWPLLHNRFLRRQGDGCQIREPWKVNDRKHHVDLLRAVADTEKVSLQVHVREIMTLHILVQKPVQNAPTSGHVGLHSGI